MLRFIDLEGVMNSDAYAAVDKALGDILPDPAPNPLKDAVTLQEADESWAHQRMGKRNAEEMMEDAKKQARTMMLLERRGAEVNESNWKRYHGSQEM